MAYRKNGHHLYAEKDAEIARLNDALAAQIAHGAAMKARHTILLDALDSMQARHDAELRAETAANERLRETLVRYRDVVAVAEFERDDLRDAVVKLVERVEVAHGDFTSWAHSRIRIPRVLDPLPPMPTDLSGLASEGDLWAYASGMITFLRGALSAERRAHAETRQAVRVLEAQLAKRDAELLASAMHVSGNASSMRGARAEQPTEVDVGDVERAQADNAVLEYEVEKLASRIRRAQVVAGKKAVTSFSRAPDSQRAERHRSSPKRSRHHRDAGDLDAPSSNVGLDADMDRLATRTSRTRPAEADSHPTAHSTPPPPGEHWHRRWRAHGDAEAHIAEAERPKRAQSRSRPRASHDQSYDSPRHSPAVLFVSHVDEDNADPDRTLRSKPPRHPPGEESTRPIDIHAAMDEEITRLGAQIAQFQLERRRLMVLTSTLGDGGGGGENEPGAGDEGARESQPGAWGGERQRGDEAERQERMGLGLLPPSPPEDEHLAYEYPYHHHTHAADGGTAHLLNSRDQDPEHADDGGGGELTMELATPLLPTVILQSSQISPLDLDVSSGLPSDPTSTSRMGDGEAEAVHVDGDASEQAVRELMSRAAGASNGRGRS